MKGKRKFCRQLCSKYFETFDGLAIFSFITSETKCDYR